MTQKSGGGYYYHDHHEIYLILTSELFLWINTYFQRAFSSSLHLTCTPSYTLDPSPIPCFLLGNANNTTDCSGKIEIFHFHLFFWDRYAESEQQKLVPDPFW